MTDLQNNVPTQVSEDDIREGLRTVNDPELGINIVDLGLIYGIQLEEGLLEVTMTLTAPGCPLAGMIESQINEALDGMPGVTNVKVNIVFSPPWNPSMMSDDAKMELGYF